MSLPTLARPLLFLLAVSTSSSAVPQATGAGQRQPAVNRPLLTQASGVALGAVGEPSLSPGANTLSLSWTDTNSLESGYEAQVSLDGGVTWMVKGATGPNGASLVLQQLDLPASPAQELRVRVRATDAVAPAGSVNTVVSGNEGTPVSSHAIFAHGTRFVPTELAVSSFGGGGVELQWRDLNVYESGWEAHLSFDGGAAWTVAATREASSTQQPRLLVPAAVLLAGSPSNLKVRVRPKAQGEASNAVGSPASSDFVSAAIQVQSSGLLQPAGAPTIGVAGTTTIQVHWEDTNVFEAGYEVQTSLDGSAWTANTQAGPDSTTATATNLVIPTASSGSLLYLRVRTRVPGEGPTPSGPAIATQPVVFGPSDLRPVTDVRASSMSGTPGQANGQLRLDWLDTNAAEGGYEVQRTYSAPGSSSGWATVATVGADVDTASIAGLVFPANASQHLRLRVRTKAQGEPGTPPPQIHSSDYVVAYGTVLPAGDFELYGVNPLAALVRFRDESLPAYTGGYEAQSSEDGGATWRVRDWGGDGLMPSLDKPTHRRGTVAGAVVPSFPNGGSLRVRLRTLAAGEAPRVAGAIATTSQGDVLSTAVTFDLAPNTLPALFAAADMYYQAKTADGCELVFTDTNIDENNYTAWITYGLVFPPNSPYAGQLMYYRNVSVGEGTGVLPEPAADGAVQRVMRLVIPYEALEGGESSIQSMTVQRRTRVESVSRLPGGGQRPLQPADSVVASTVQEDPRFSIAQAIDWGGELLQAQTPGQATGLHARQEDINLTSLTLRWTDQSTVVNEAHRFEVYRIADGDDPVDDESWTLAATLGTLGDVYNGSSSVSLSVAGLLPSRTYGFRVRSLRQGPWVATSATVSAAGSGYAVGDQLSTTGHIGTSAVLRVASIGAGGAVTALQVQYGGQFGARAPGSIVLSGGQGSGARATLGFALAGSATTYGSGWSNIYTVPMATPVYTPENLRRTIFGAEQVNLAWNPSPYADGYQVRWSLSPTVGPWTVVPGAGLYFPADALEQVVTGLAECTEHYFQVRAANTIPATDILSPWSTSLGIRTKPLAPSGLVMTPGTRTASRVGIQWTPNSTSATHIRVERRASNETAWTPIRDIYSPPSNPDTTYVTGLDPNDDDGIQPNSQQWFRVRALYSTLTTGANPVLADPDVVVGGPGEEIVIDLCDCDTAAAAGTPAAFAATTNSISVSWPAWPNATDYRLMYSIDANLDGVADDWTNVSGDLGFLPGTTTSYTVGGLQEGARYYFKVKAFRRNIQPTYETQFSAVEDGWTRLRAPVVTVSGSGQANLVVSWTNTSPVTTSYRVNCTANLNINAWRDSGDSLVNAPATSYTYQGPYVYPSTDYRVRVVAVRSLNGQAVTASVPLEQLSIWPAPNSNDPTGSTPELPAPTNLAVTDRGIDRVSVQWGYPADGSWGGGFLRYEAYVRDDGNLTWQPGWISGALAWYQGAPDATQSFTDEALVPGTTTPNPHQAAMLGGGLKYVRVRTFWSIAQSGSAPVGGPYSSTDGMPVTLCNCDTNAVPGTPSATTATTSSISLTWPAFAGATNYRLFYSIDANVDGVEDGYVNVSGANGYLPGTTTSYTVSGLQEGARYYFKIKAFRTDVQPVYETQFSGRREGWTRLRAPVVTVAESGVADLRVTWTNTSPVTTSYRVRSSANDNLGAWADDDYVVNAPASSFTMLQFPVGAASPRLYPSTDYRVRLVAVRSVNGQAVTASVPLSELSVWPAPNTNDAFGSTRELPTASNLAITSRTATTAGIAWTPWSPGEAQCSPLQNPGCNYAGGYLRFMPQSCREPIESYPWVDGHTLTLPGGDFNHVFDSADGIVAGASYRFRVRTYWSRSQSGLPDRDAEGLISPGNMIDETP